MKKAMPTEEMPTPDELAKQAWFWLRLITSGQASTGDADQFRRWVRSSVAHQAAYNAAKAEWDTFKSPAGAVLHNSAEAAKFNAYTQRGIYRHRRAFLGAAASAAVAAGVAITYPPLGLWPSPAEWRADYRTATGEQRTVALAGNVEVTLNTQTSIRRRTDGVETVGLDLIDGEAAVDLREMKRPFAVTASVGRSVSDTGMGQFEVRYIEDKVCVTCIQGTVRIEHPAGTRTLQARQQTVYDARSVSNIAAIGPADMPAWREGLLVFHQTRLADAITEINRYRPGRLLLINDSVRNNPVSGRFSLAALDAAVSQLQYVFDLRARSMIGGILILS